ncbi:MAG: hypothetical protein LBQ76_08575 [Candidatus Fibromonas sp.]|nr:hypothetical protein [Candidatus Fibromonas sp.]
MAKIIIKTVYNQSSINWCPSDGECGFDVVEHENESKAYAIADHMMYWQDGKTYAVSVIDGKLSKYRSTHGTGDWVDASKGKRKALAQKILKEQKQWVADNKRKATEAKKRKPSKSKPLTNKRIVEQIEDMQKFLDSNFKNLNRSTRVNKGSMIAVLSEAAMMLERFKENFKKKRR